VRGYAHLQQSRQPEAVEEFQRSLAAARSGDAVYEIALTLNALGRLGDASAAAEAKGLLERLDVGQLAEVPF
jgi:single-stranded DNA-specific DHH superfamily exonuclease